MNHFMSIKDCQDIEKAIAHCKALKENPYGGKTTGVNKTLGMIFMNPSLRTKISTTKAAQNLGMNILPIDFAGGSWALEFDEGVVMDADKAEHIKEAAAVVGRYCDVIAIRSFAKLQNREDDEREQIFQAFQQYSGCPVVNLESALRHPLQTLADLVTIEHYKKVKKPKVVLSWAPHPRALPHAVVNSFIEGMDLMDYDFVITHPEGYELDPNIVGDTPVTHDQDEALAHADFVYVKNWSSWKDYGQVTSTDRSWTVNADKLKAAPNAKVMHCLPVRRNMVLADDVLDGPQSIVIDQAENRLYSAQHILTELL